MLDLKTGVQFKEEKIIGVSVVQVLDGTGSDVTNRRGQTLGSTLHFFECFGLDDGRRTFLENLLESTLGGTVTTVQGNSISVFISNNLDFNVTGVFTKLHDKNRGSDNFVSDLDVGILEVIFIVDETDTFTTTSFGGLDHDTVFVTNASCSFNSFFDGTGSSLREGFVWDSSLFVEFGLQRTIIGSTEGSTPWNRRDLGSLGENVRSDLVTKNTHNRGRGANEFDSIRIQSSRKIRVFTGMTPTGPHSVATLLDSQFRDEFNVGVVVSVNTSRNFNIGVGQSDEFSIGVDVLRRGHGNELNSAFVSKFHVGPLTHGHDRLGGSHTIVSDQYLFDGSTSSSCFDIILDRSTDRRNGFRLLDGRLKSSVGEGQVLLDICIWFKECCRSCDRK